MTSKPKTQGKYGGIGAFKANKKKEKQPPVKEGFYVSSDSDNDDDIVINVSKADLEEKYKEQPVLSKIAYVNSGALHEAQQIIPEPQQPLPAIPTTSSSSSSTSTPSPVPMTSLTTLRDNLRYYSAVSNVGVEGMEENIRQGMSNLIQESLALENHLRTNPYYIFATEVATNIGKSGKNSHFFIRDTASIVLSHMNTNNLQKEKNTKDTVFMLQRNFNMALNALRTHYKTRTIGPNILTQDEIIKRNIQSAQKRSIRQEDIVQKELDKVLADAKMINEIFITGSMLAHKQFFMSQELINIANSTFEQFKRWVSAQYGASVGPPIDNFITNPGQRTILSKLCALDHMMTSVNAAYRPTSNQQMAQINAQIRDNRISLWDLTIHPETEGEAATIPTIATLGTPVATATVYTNPIPQFDDLDWQHELGSIEDIMGYSDAFFPP